MRALSRTPEDHMESHLRTALKTITWRTLAAFVTGTLAWAATGSLEAGIAMGTADTLVKFVLYYLHERAWAGVRIGYVPEPAAPPARWDPRSEPVAFGSAEETP